MAVYSVSYRIHEDSSYDERRHSIVLAISKEARDTPWDETTSQAIFESDKNTKQLCHDLYHGSDLIESKDLLLVINLSVKSYDQRGAKYPHTLDSLMSKR